MKGATAYFLCEETRILILIFIETQSRGGTIGEALAVRAPEMCILIKMWTAGRGTLCLAVKNHCRANSKILKLARNADGKGEKNIDKRDDLYTPCLYSGSMEKYYVADTDSLSTFFVIILIKLLRSPCETLFLSTFAYVSPPRSFELFLIADDCERFRYWSRVKCTN
jgi:hypothetical protein